MNGEICGRMKSMSKKREQQLRWAAGQAAKTPLEKCRCHKHPDRYAATSISEPVCWECFYGPERFAKLFKKDAETFYQPGGPGWAGD